jgi:hypothetical protein
MSMMAACRPTMNVLSLTEPARVLLNLAHAVLIAER